MSGSRRAEHDHALAIVADVAHRIARSELAASGWTSLLAGLGLDTEPVIFAPARAPPQADLPWDDAS